MNSTGSGCGTCVSPSGGTFRFTPRFQIRLAEDAEKNETHYSYDDRGNVASRTAGEAETEYTWHSDYSLPLTVTRPSVSDGTVTDEYGYDSAGNLLTLTENKDTDAERSTAFSWNTYGQLTGIDGPRTGVSDTVTFSYYSNDSSQGLNRGMLHQITNGLNHTVTFSSYNAFGKPGQAADANGVTAVYAYDGQGRLTSRTAAGITTGYDYDDAGRLVTLTLPGDREITYEYTDAGWLEKITGSDGSYILYGYDSEGNRTDEDIHDAGGTLKQYADFTYDAFNRLEKVVYPGTDSPYEEYGYDGNNNIVSYRDGSAKITGYAYDALQRLTALTRSGDIETGYDYDTNDNVTGVTDAETNATVYTYDDAGNLKTAASPDTGSTSYDHDDAGNVISRTDANDITVTYEYDALNRLTDISFPDSSQDIGFGYDSGTYGKGRMTSVTDPSGSISMVYNSLGMVTQETRITGGQTYSTVYAYDGTSADLTGMTYPSGLALVFSRDAGGRISGITADGNTLVSGVSYLPFGPLKNMTAGALNIAKTFDQRYLMSGIQAGSIMNLTYTHDGAGNAKTVSGITVPTPSSGTTNYSHTANKLTGSTGNTEKTYTHDNAGNITSDGTRTFVYNQNSRLVQVTEGSSVIAEYAYDGFGRRVKKTVGSDVVHYHYDLNGILISETDGSGSPIRDYVYLNGEPVAMKVYGSTDAWYYFLNDHLGTPQKMVDSAGAVVWSAGYLPFGEAQLVVANVENNLRFPGQYFDAETGLHYNWHRYYDPETGRYWSADPIGLDGGINLYSYCLNNPINYIDPYGLTGLEATVGGAGAYATGGGAASAAAWVAGPVAAGVLGYYGTSSLIQGTYFGGKIGSDLYDLLHPPAAEMAKGGKQNIDNEYVRDVQKTRPNDPCKYLRDLYNDTCDKKERRKIKQAMKRYNCDGKDRYR